MARDQVNILLVDDQPAKLLTYEVILRDLGENVISADSPRSALVHLLKRDIAVVLLDVCMPELDGFELATMIREHPRCKNTAIIFISGIYLSEADLIRGYEFGAVDYVQIPVVPEVLRSKVKVFVDLYRKTRALERLNRELEDRVATRTRELVASNAELRRSERLRDLALAAGQMGTWHWDTLRGLGHFDEGQCRIFGVDPASFEVTPASVRALIHPDDWERLAHAWSSMTEGTEPFQAEFRVCRPDGTRRYCFGAAAAVSVNGAISQLSGVTADITERKEADKRQALLAREVDHRAMNVLSVVQSIVRLTRAEDMEAYVATIDGRIQALAQSHALLSRSRWQGAELEKLVEDELRPYRDESGDRDKFITTGQNVMLEPTTAQTVALALHELVTNAAKYGALSTPPGRVQLAWDIRPDSIVLRWLEKGGPAVEPPARNGFGTRVISAIIEGQLGGAATFDWQREGLQCTISIPMEANAGRAAAPRQ
jgi:PAS domain S-box-containing protein